MNVEVTDLRSSVALLNAWLSFSLALLVLLWLGEFGWSPGEEHPVPSVTGAPPDALPEPHGNRTRESIAAFGCARGLQRSAARCSGRHSFGNAHWALRAPDRQLLASSSRRIAHSAVISSAHPRAQSRRRPGTSWLTTQAGADQTMVDR